MDTMQFRDFIFRHNPASIQCSDSTLIAEDFCPGSGSYVRGLGKKARVITCSGSFMGATAGDALEQAAEFRRKTADDQSGVLFVPGFAPFPAYLKEFVLDAQGDGRILPYTIVFVERGDNN